MSELISENQTKLIIGLGNPGTQYENTKHNVGFKVIDILLSEFSSEAQSKHKYDAVITPIKIGRKNILLAKPHTYMNLSGQSAAKICAGEKILPSQILVIHDDMDINLGKIKIKTGGSSAGHNGVESIIQCLETTQFPRLRIGIGRNNKPSIDNADFVLSEFQNEEKNIIKKILEISAEAVKLMVRRNLLIAMNTYNNKEFLPDEGIN